MMNEIDRGNLTILLIEDDQKTRQIVRSSLVLKGWRILEATTGTEGIAKALDVQPELILLDLGLPDIDGIEVVRQIRQQLQTPILVLSARSLEKDKVEALNSGADDFLTKPFGVSELEARMNAILRRVPGHQSALFQNEELMINLSQRKVELRGVSVSLTPIQFRLLSLLVQNSSKVLTHRQILKEVWGPEHIENIEYLRIYMGQLRHKIEANPARPRYLQTETGIGYRFIP
jgi:two-component system KDP operon response regulator KdpE